MPLSQSPGNVGATTIGVSDVITRNTEQDTPSQAYEFSGGNQTRLQFGQYDVSQLGPQNHYPAASVSWSNWFQGGASQSWPTGKPSPFVASPDPTGIITAIQSGRGAIYPGHTWVNQFAGDYQHAHHTATGKVQQPYSAS